MKKLLVLLLFLTGNVSSQTTASLTYGQQSDNDTGALSTVTTLNIKTKISDSFAGDILLIDKINATNNAITLRTEAGLTYSYTMDSITPYVRGALAQKQKSGSDTLYYYAIEGGIITKLPYGLSLKTGFARRNALGANDVDFSNEFRYVLTYDITKNDVISAGSFKAMSGDAPATTTFIGYSRRF